MAGKTVKQVDQAKVWEIHEPVWSPDSRWIAWSQEEEEGMDASGFTPWNRTRRFPVTDGWYTSTTPAFSGDGKYLFFVSERDFNPIYSGTEWNHAYRDMARIYLVTLAKDTPSPFKPRSDESGETPPKTEEPKKDAPIKVDIDGLQDRLLALPIQAGSYRNLQSVGSTLYYIRQGAKDVKPALQMYDLNARKETALGSSAAMKSPPTARRCWCPRTASTPSSICQRPGEPWRRAEPVRDGNAARSPERVEADLQRVLAADARLLLRSQHARRGLEGDADRYEPLLPHVNHRADLTYLIGEMIGELNVGHAYVGGGDMPKAQRIKLGLFGARIVRDKTTGYYQISKILKGANWDGDLRSPLTEIGVDAREKDYIIAINGQPTNEMANLYEALVGTAGKQVTLKLNSEPKVQGSREVVVVPIDE